MAPERITTVADALGAQTLVVVDLPVDDGVDMAAIVMQWLATVGRQVVDGEAAVAETFSPRRQSHHCHSI